MEDFGYKRLHLEVLPDMHRDLQQRLPRGTISEVIRKLVSALFDAMDRDGDVTLYKVLQGKFKIVGDDDG